MTNQLTLLNVEYYKNYEEFEHYGSISESEFYELMEDGHIQKITLGTYNGATNTFQNREISDAHILDAIQMEINESNFIEMFEEIFNYDELIELFTEFYDVVVIKDEIYTIDM